MTWVLVYLALSPLGDMQTRRVHGFDSYGACYHYGHAKVRAEHWKRYECVNELRGKYENVTAEASNLVIP